MNTWSDRERKLNQGSSISHTVDVEAEPGDVLEVYGILKWEVHSFLRADGRKRNDSGWTTQYRAGESQGPC